MARRDVVLSGGFYQRSLLVPDQDLTITIARQRAAFESPRRAQAAFSALEDSPALRASGGGGYGFRCRRQAEKNRQGQVGIQSQRSKSCAALEPLQQLAKPASSSKWMVRGVSTHPESPGGRSRSQPREERRILRPISDNGVGNQRTRGALQFCSGGRELIGELTQQPLENHQASTLVHGLASAIKRRPSSQSVQAARPPST